MEPLTATKCFNAPTTRLKDIKTHHSKAHYF